MGIKYNGYELFIGKEEVNIISFIGNRKKLSYDNISKIVFQYHIFSEVGYIDFKDKYGGCYRFCFARKNNEQIKRAIEYIGNQRPDIGILERHPGEMPFYEKNIFIIIMMFFCCFPLGLILLWKYRKGDALTRTMMTFTIMALWVLGLFYQYNSYRNTMQEIQSALSNIQDVSDGRYVEQLIDGMGSSGDTEVPNESDNVIDTFYVGDVYDSEDLTIMFIDAGDYTVDNEYMQPSAGNKYIYVEFSVKNTSDNDIYTGGAMFKCYTDNTECSQTIFGDNTMTSIVSLSPDRNTKGRIYFEVPQSYNSIEVEYEIDFLSSSKIYFKIE